MDKYFAPGNANIFATYVEGIRRDSMSFEPTAAEAFSISLERCATSLIMSILFIS